MTADRPLPEGASRRPAMLPPALRLPAAAGALVFAVAVGTTQVALLVTNRQADQQLEQLGKVYLDGIAASVRAGLEAGDGAYVADRFARAFTEQRGVAERGLFAFGPDGTLLARHGDPALPEAVAAGLPENGWRMDEEAGTAWAARRVDGAGRIVAALDIGPLLESRSRLSWTIVLVDLALAGIFAALTWLVLGRVGRPLRALVAALSEGARRAPAPLSDVVVAQADARSAAVLRAYNHMVDGVRERERLANELADREQAAALGRLAATVAHEVRNPLGGLSTAVSTLRRFGDDPTVREEALGFLDRGIGALDRIVTSTLNLYRPEDDRRLTRTDLEDLAQLVRPAAARGGVGLDVALDLPGGEIGVGAGGVRQVLLNLLLNACEATPRGGAVGFRAWLEADALACEIADAGPGLGAAEAARLAGQGEAPQGSRRLGLGVVVGLLGNLDARASVAERPGGGTLIRLSIPLTSAGAPA
ncbi:sensor histidine kinase [Falsiroseomonas bella]|nr:ATP-binding protein [Falsiroseomonas bella]